MKMYLKTEKVNKKEKLLVAFDISKDKLDFHTEHTDLQGKIICWEDSFANQSDTIISKLGEISRYSMERGYKGLHVVCETTGGYEMKLLRLARQQGHGTSYVSGESVSKYKMVESNDTGKTDEKDPRVMMVLAKLDKVLSCRHLSGEYLLLRECNRMYDNELKACSQIKGQLHFVLQDLFCDYSFKKDFLYDRSGRALVKHFHCSPYRIVSAGYGPFFKQMKEANKRIRNMTIKRLWENAQSSQLHCLEAAQVLLLEEHLLNLWEEFLLHEARLERIRQQMIDLYVSLRQKGACVPAPEKGLMNEFHIARILGETGPVQDFPNANMLIRYAGLNLCERRSGRYKGLVRISKKGRSGLRNVLSLAILALVKKTALFGQYYHAKKAAGMQGSKIMVAVMRKFLKVFYAMSKPNAQFNAQRLFVSECQYEYKIAA
jgi:transposase